MIDILIPTAAQGLMWALLALGVYITFRVLDVADLSVEGSFPLGAAVAATALVNGLGITVAFILAAVAGALAGIVTGFLTTKLRIPALLAGILTMIGLYSVNLHVMGKANVALLRVDTVFTYAENLGLTPSMAMFIVGLGSSAPTSARLCVPRAATARWPALRVSTPTRWWCSVF